MTRLRVGGAALAAAVALVAMASIVVNTVSAGQLPPGFDEVFFADMTANLLGGLGRVPALLPGVSPTEIHVYGPVYFALQAALAGSLGLDTASFRASNLVAGYLSAVLLALLVWRYRQSWRLAALAAALVLLDISFNRNLVSGRMDLLALSAVLASSLAASGIARAPVRWAATAGLFAALAVLTTPRAAFLLGAPATLAILALAGCPGGLRGQLAAVGAGAACALLPVIAWIISVGGLDAYLQAGSGDAIVRQRFLGPQFLRSAYDNVGLVGFVVLAVLRARTLHRDPLVLATVAALAGFSLFVIERGPYAGMLMPWVVVGILLMAADTLRTRPRLAPAALLAVCLVGVPALMGASVLGLRGADLWRNADCREDAAVGTALLGALPAGSTVALAPHYYHLARGRALVPELVPDALPRRRSDWPDFVVLADGRSHPETGTRQVRERYRVMARYECPVRPVPWLPASFRGRTDYSGTLYRRP